tara:strand:- start:278 stop:1195 length:918 start_codon:yes stop_codon:yes gene_type:complete
MKKYIISTSINPPTKAIRKFDTMNGWKLIVVGDLKTPKNYKLKNGIYLSPKDQIKINKKLSNLIGWNCIERRNFGFILAKKLGAEIVAIVDDDNIPKKNWGKNLLVKKKVSINYCKTKLNVFDPIYLTNYKHLWHRGFPVELIDDRDAKVLNKKKIKVDIQADFWDGDPDIDAICRMMYKPNCNFKTNPFPFFSNKLSPFNSQNTFIDAKLLKYYFLFPDQGRIHDIWASYFIQYYNKNLNVVYNKASVFQKRNSHNLIIDLKNEFNGLKKNFKFLNLMFKKKFNYKKEFSQRSVEAYREYKKHF